MDKWSKKWTEDNVSEELLKTTTKWFMGESEGLLPNKTKIDRIEKTCKPPYVPFNKYKCELLKQQQPQVTVTSCAGGNNNSNNNGNNNNSNS